MIDKQTIWRLTLSHYPEAVAAGVRPHPAYLFADDSPGAYTPTEILFKHPPSRQDFLAVVQRTPWMQGMRILPLVEKSDWPMIDWMHKGSSVPVLNEAGAQVGELQVWREELYTNTPYQTQAVTVDEINAVVGRMHTEKRQQAKAIISAKENWIREQISLGDGGSIRQLIRQVLVGAGLLKT